MAEDMSIPEADETAKEDEAPPVESGETDSEDTAAESDDAEDAEAK